jgi:hypothetical protein
MVDGAFTMDFNPSDWGPLNLNAQTPVDDLVRQQQAVRSVSNDLQPGLPSDHQGMHLANSSFATLPFAPTSSPEKPPRGANPAFQSHFFGQGQQLDYNIDPTFFPSTAASYNFNPSHDNQYQFNPTIVPSAAASSDPDQTRPQGLPGIADVPSAAYMGSSSPIDATTIAPGATVTMLPPAADGLRFESYEAAFSTVDPMFRDPITIKDDDVLEVVQHKRTHVKSLVDAMRHGGFMSATDYKNTELGRNQTVDPQAFDYWQNGASEIVEAHLTMPRVGEKIECVAWEVFEEIVRVHRTGFRFTKEKADVMAKCSKRIEDAVGVIRGFALIRQKLLERGNINDLATNPKAFASVIAQYHRSNCKRPASTGQGRRGAKAEGAIGKAYMPRAEHKDWIKAVKAEAKAAGGGGALNVNEQQQSRSAAMITSQASGSVPVVKRKASALVASNQAAQRPPALPTLGTGASLLEPSQSQGHEATSALRFGIDNFFDFERNIDPSLTEQFMPRRGVGHGVGDGVRLGEFTFEASIDGISYPDQQVPGGAQHHSRHGGESGRPSQLAAAYGSPAIVADTGSTRFFQTYGGAPGEGPNKRLRTDSAAVLEDA